MSCRAAQSVFSSLVALAVVGWWTLACGEVTRPVRPVPLPGGASRHLVVVGVGADDRAVSPRETIAERAGQALQGMLTTGTDGVVRLIGDRQTFKNDFLRYPTRGNLVSRLQEFSDGLDRHDQAVVLYVGEVHHRGDKVALATCGDGDEPSAGVDPSRLTRLPGCRLAVLVVTTDPGNDGMKQLRALAAALENAPIPVVLAGLTPTLDETSTGRAATVLAEALAGAGAGFDVQRDVLTVTAESIAGHLSETSAAERFEPKPELLRRWPPGKTDPEPEEKPKPVFVHVLTIGAAVDRPVVELLDVQSVFARRDRAADRLSRQPADDKADELRKTIARCESRLLKVMEPVDSLPESLDRVVGLRRGVAGEVARQGVFGAPQRRQLVTIRLASLAGRDGTDRQLVQLREELETARQDAPARVERLVAQIEAIGRLRERFDHWVDDPGRGLPLVARDWGHDRFELDLDDGVTMPLVMIRPGTFMMGAAKGVLGRPQDEKPRHEVTLTRRFYMGATEVTEAQYAAVLTPGRPPAKDEADMPVRRLKWIDAAAFCKAMSDRLGVSVRLPTEARWEYACRAGSDTAYFFGNDVKKVNDYAWIESNARKKVHPVGRLKPNAWGLYDMLGNVEEWTGDRYGRYPDGAVTEPTGPAKGKQRVLRGGSCISSPAQVHCSVRFGLDEDRVNPYGGLRVIVIP
ncbi:MAG: SUMF1/EgtB/PvdO family nonheme iron enzyme [Planctomycetota bacterium]